MSNDDAKFLVTAFVESFEENAGRDPYTFLLPDVVITINGTTPLSGRFEGLNLVRKILVNTATSVIDRIHIRIDRLISRGTKIAALLEVSGTTRDGQTFNVCGDLCGCVFETRGGFISVIQAFPDTSLIDSVLFGWNFVPNRDQ